MRRLVGLLLVVCVFCTSLPILAWESQESKRTDWGKRSDRAAEWFFEEIPRHIGNDLKETFWNPWHALAIVAGMGLILGVHEEDPEIQQAFQPERPFGSTFDNVMKYGAHPIVLGGGTALAYGISQALGDKKAALMTGTMFEAIFLTETVTIGLQLATHRRRPDGSNSRSFPSGHTSGAFALAAVVEEFYGPWFGVPSFILASLVGISRIDSNKHVATDVLAGALLGTLMGLGTAKFHKQEFPNFFIVPTVGEDSAGLSFVHRF